MSHNKQWRVLCWNIGGINSEQKQLALRNAISSSGCSVVCLQETKRVMFDKAFVKLLCPRNFDQFVFMPSASASGGLITIWDSSVFAGTTMFIKSFAVGVNFTSLQTAKSWSLVNVYGPCDGPDRITFTSWLFDIEINDTDGWLIVGDFNYIRNPDNRNKPRGNANDMLIFNDFIHSQSLVELPVKGRMFTWSNMQNNPLLEQLDWYFTSANWTTNYPNTVVTPLPKPVSDHTPSVSWFMVD